MHSYKTIKEQVRVKIAVGACRFYACLSPCDSEKKARLFLEQVKEALPGATHYVFALRIGAGDKILARSDDAGEPAGTAGPPMLGVLEKHELTDIMLVGTRYFGGVKLGIGGLVRAYRACAEAGVEGASIYSREISEEARLVIPYDYMGAVVREVEAVKGEVARFEYGQYVALEIRYPMKEKHNLMNKVTSTTKGHVKLEPI